MTESMGCAFIISSTHIDIKFLYIMEVGFKKVSPREIIGNIIGNAPLDKIPFFKLSKIFKIFPRENQYLQAWRPLQRPGGLLYVGKA